MTLGMFRHRQPEWVSSPYEPRPNTYYGTMFRAGVVGRPFPIFSLLRGLESCFWPHSGCSVKARSPQQLSNFATAGIKKAKLMPFNDDRPRKRKRQPPLSKSELREMAERAIAGWGKPIVRTPAPNTACPNCGHTESVTAHWARCPECGTRK